MEVLRTCFHLTTIMSWCVEDALDQCMEELGKAIATPNGYKLLLPDKGDPDNLYLACKIQQLLQEAMVLQLAYLHAQDIMPDS